MLNKKKYAWEGDNSQGQNRLYQWVNTNKLLWKDINYNGLKTGTTKTAGACLVSNYETECLNLIIIVFNWNNDTSRWEDTDKLKDWAIDRLNSVEEYLESINKGGKAITYDSNLPN